MSYARFSANSDVYIYADVSGGLTCCGCIAIPDDPYQRLLTLNKALKHFSLHESLGHNIPSGWIEFVKVIRLHENYLFHDGPDPELAP